MMFYAYLPYAVTEIYCAVFAVTIWLRLNGNIGSEHEVRQLRNMIYSYLAMLVTDALWALTEDGILCPPRLLNAFINALTVMSIACGCYFWFRFIEDRLHFAFASKRGLNLLLKLPLLLLCGLDLASIFTGWLFYIDEENHYQSTSAFMVHTIVNYFYLVIPTGYAIYRALKTHSRQDREEYWTYALYMVGPLISGMLEDKFPHVPLLALNIFMVILILFLMMQNMQVYHDALTGLNNRRRLSQYLESCLAKASPEHPILLFIMDLNNFKAINDVHGHLEGDHALHSFANTLKECAARCGAFVARYGGDEFCMVVEAAQQAPADLADDIRRSVTNAHIREVENGRDYTLSVSIGYTVCEGAESTPDSVLARADEQLYINKKRWHTDNP